MWKNLEQNLELHRKIVASFRYNPYLDFLSGLELNSLLVDDHWPDLPVEKEVSVIGPSTRTESPKGYVIVADSALRDYRGRCDMIVSDLDGPVERLLELKRSVKVIHAHGDNISKLRATVPFLSGWVLGTTQSIPIGRVRNIGGFTDGDRSIIMASLMGAKTVYIHGFDYDNPVDEPKETKRKKMRFGREIVNKLKDVNLVYI